MQNGDIKRNRQEEKDINSPVSPTEEGNTQYRRRKLVESIHYSSDSINYCTDVEHVFQEDEDINEARSLTLLEELVLLAMNPEKGYISLFNDRISFVLRGCILLELVLRGRVYIDESSWKVLVYDKSATGELILDEALKIIANTTHGVEKWIELLSGETWNPLNITFQMRNLKDRIAKGMIEKGILRGDQTNVLFFSMKTYPIVDLSRKRRLCREIIDDALGRGVSATLRQLCRLICAKAAGILRQSLENADSDTRNNVRARVKEMTKEFSDDLKLLKVFPQSDNRICPIHRSSLKLISSVFTVLDSFDHALV